MIKDYRMLLLLSVIICVLLAGGIHKAMQTEWQQYQKAYYEQLEMDDYRIEVVQKNVITPKGVLIDRCATCHIGATNKDAAAFDQPLTTHRPIAPGMAAILHDLNKWGCTVCHDGNGRGLDETDAHGHLQHWTKPLLAGHMVQASCTKCHEIAVRDLEGADYLNRGRRLFIEKACWACHAIDGVSSGTRGPNLSDVGDKFSIDYVRTSMLEPKANIESSRMPKFDWLDDGEEAEQDLEALVVYLMSQRSVRLRDANEAPIELQEMKAAQRPKPTTPSVEIGEAIFYGRDSAGAVRGGCINCHSYNTGPATGTDLHWSGLYEPSQATLKGAGLSVPFEGGSICPNLSFTVAARGKDYVKDHIRDPNAHVLDSIMPKFVTDDPANSLSEVELDSLVLFLESISRKPTDRRPEVLFATHCMSCHGENFDGRGRLNQKNMLLDPMPRNFRHQFVLAYQDRLANSIKTGIQGTAMPAWEELLTDQEVDALVAYITRNVTEGKQLDTKPFKRPELPLPKVGDTDYLTDRPLTAGDAEAGERTFARICTGCHGKLANGKGPDAYFLEYPLPRNLLNKEFMNQAAVTDERLYRSIRLGVPGTPMPSHDRVLSDQQTLDTMAYLRQLSKDQKETD